MLAAGAAASAGIPANALAHAAAKTENPWALVETARIPLLGTQVPATEADLYRFGRRVCRSYRQRKRSRCRHAV